MFINKQINFKYILPSNFEFLFQSTIKTRQQKQEQQEQQQKQ